MCCETRMLTFTLSNMEPLNQSESVIKSNFCFKTTKIPFTCSLSDISAAMWSPPCYLSPADWLSGLHSGQECWSFPRFPGGVRGQRGGLLWTSSAGGSARPAQPVLRNRWRIHLSPARDLPPSQSPGPVQHHGRSQHYRPLQECVPADHRFLFSGKQVTSWGEITRMKSRIKVKYVIFLEKHWCRWEWKRLIAFQYNHCAERQYICWNPRK